ncbi:MAG: HigA family addiction module antitoxin [Candidatus Binataceae bacterium]
MTKPKKLSPVPPREILLKDYLEPEQISINRAAMDLHVPISRMYEIIKGKRAITADTALRLGRYLGTSAEMWMGLQADYDLQTAEDERSAEIQAEVRQLKRAYG